MTDAALLEKYETYLRDEKKSSENTVSSYMRDLRQFSSYVATNLDSQFGGVTESEVSGYMTWLKNAGK